RFQSALRTVLSSPRDSTLRKNSLRPCISGNFGFQSGIVKSLFDPGYHIPAPSFHEADLVGEVDVEPDLLYAHIFELVQSLEAILRSSDDRISAGEIIFQSAFGHQPGIRRLARLLMFEVVVALMNPIEDFTDLRWDVLILFGKPS